MEQIHCTTTATITDLKRNPHAIMQAGEGEAVAILSHNKTAFYCVPPALFEALLEAAENAELQTLAEERLQGPFIRVSLDEL